jgi:hypothetical protein
VIRAGGVRGSFGGSGVGAMLREGWAGCGVESVGFGDC